MPEHLTLHLLTMAELHRAGRYDRLADGVERVTPAGAADPKRSRPAEFVSFTQNEKVIAVIVANPVMINAFRSGIAGDGAFPRRRRVAKIHWNPKKTETFPGTTVPASCTTSTSW